MGLNQYSNNNLSIYVDFIISLYASWKDISNSYRNFLFNNLFMIIFMIFF